MSEAPTEEAPPSQPGDAFDRALWRTRQVVGLLIVLAELAWIIDAANGHRYSLPVRLRARRAQHAIADGARRGWMRATAGPVSKREAPAVVWEAWAHAEGRTP